MVAWRPARTETTTSFGAAPASTTSLRSLSATSFPSSALVLPTMSRHSGLRPAWKSSSNTTVAFAPAGTAV